jgi:hypothetical protein
MMCCLSKPKGFSGPLRLCTPNWRTTQEYVPIDMTFAAFAPIRVSILSVLGLARLKLQNPPRGAGVRPFQLSRFALQGLLREA